MSNRLSADQWSRYWEKGTVTTFLGRYTQNYDGPVRAFWASHAAELPDDATVVDLGTGNGALAILMAEELQFRGNAATVHAVDYAKIDPKNLVLSQLHSDLKAMITLHPDTDMSATSIADNSADCVVSQFGFEYGNTIATIEEIGRITKHNARVAIMCHHNQSILYKQATEGIAHVDACVADDLHSPVKSLLRRLEVSQQKGLDPAKDKKAKQLREQINSITEKLHVEMEKYEEPGQIGFYLQNTMALFGQGFKSHPIGEKIKLLDQVYDETLAYKHRMQDLMTAALTDDDIEKIQQALNHEGFTVIDSRLHEVEGHDFCYSLVATRSE